MSSSSSSSSRGRVRPAAHSSSDGGRLQQERDELKEEDVGEVENTPINADETEEQKKARILDFINRLMETIPECAKLLRSEFTINKLKEAAGFLNMSRSFSKSKLIDNIRSHISGTRELDRLERD